MQLPTFAEVQTAAERIRPFVHRTPVFTSETLDKLAGRSVFCKGELFQKTGSFKYRGATNAVQKLDDATASRGVVTHSSGNHGQALAKAAQVRGIPAVIVMPPTASPVKKAAILGYGATVVHADGPGLKEREAKTAEMLEKTGGVLIPPFDHPDVIAGQGTAAMELFQDVPGLEGVIAPIGGGGLISGFCLGAQGINSKARVFGAEPTGADAAARSKTANDRVLLERPTSIADGLLANYLGNLTWVFIRDRVESVFTVSEEQIREAMKFVWERMKLVIEPSAAVGIAVILSEEFRKVEGVRKVGVVLCGGNVSLEKLYW